MNQNIRYGQSLHYPRATRLGWVTGIVLCVLLVFSFLSGSGAPANETTRFPETTEAQRHALDLLRETIALVEENYVSMPDMRKVYSAGLTSLQRTLGKERFDVRSNDARHYILHAGDGKMEVLLGGEGLKGLARVEDAYRFALAHVAPREDKEGELRVMYGVLRGMVQSLDPFSSFLPPDTYREMQVETSGHYGGVGISITLREKKLTVVSPIEDSPAQRAGIRGGDEIYTVEGELTQGWSLTDAVKRMRGEPGTSVRLGIKRNGWKAPRDFSLTRAIVKIKSVKAKVLDKKFGYLRLTAFHEQTTNELDEALDRLLEVNVQGIILDLRDNPGGLLNQSVRVAERFLPNRSMVVFTRGRHRSQTMYFRTHENGVWVDKPLIVLVNRGSASASEIVAGALRDLDRAILIGDTTFGKGSVQTIIPLSDGAGLRLTTAKYYTPLGVQIHGKGIPADVEVNEPMFSEGERMSSNRSAGSAIDEKFSPENDLQLRVALETLKKTKTKSVEVLRYNASQVKARLVHGNDGVSQAKLSLAH